MASIHRERGFNFRIIPGDHDPAHVHVYKAGGVAKIAIGDATTSAWLMSAHGMPEKAILKAVRIVDERWQEFLDAWRERNG